MDEDLFCRTNAWKGGDFRLPADIVERDAHEAAVRFLGEKEILTLQGDIRNEVLKTPKVYFTDLGLRNILLGLTSVAQLERMNQYGITLENAVVNRLSAWLPLLNPVIRLHYWRTRSKEEGDLVISKPDRLIPVEVKSDKKLQTRHLKGLRSFLQKEKEETGILVGRFEDVEMIEEGKAKIILLPHWMI